MNTETIIISTILLPALTLIVTVFLTIKTSKLKKREYIYSLYGELQIRALKELYHYLTELGYATENILLSKRQESSLHKENIEKWFMSYAKVKQHYNFNKYIIPSKLLKRFQVLLDEFQNIQKLLNQEKQISTMFSENKATGEFKLMTSDKELNEVYNELQKHNRQEIFDTTFNAIKQLRTNIENHFKSIEI